MEKRKEKAPPYDRSFQGRLDKVLEVYSGLVDKCRWCCMENAVVVDLGCGQGDFVSALARQSKTVIGVDYDKLEIEKAHEKCESFNNVTLIHSNIDAALDHLPYANVMLCFSVLHHMFGGSFYIQAKSGRDYVCSILERIQKKKIGRASCRERVQISVVA